MMVEGILYPRFYLSELAELGGSNCFFADADIFNTLIDDWLTVELAGAA